MKKKILPADRVAEIQEYYFARKLAEVASLNASGADIVSLGIGGPDIKPADSVIETLVEEARRPDSHSYQSFGGLPELRQAFSDWYARWYGVTLDPRTELQPLIGSKEGVMYISLALLNPGDGVLVPDPGYPTYTSASRIVGATIYPYDLKEEKGWQPDFEALERLPLDKIKLMWVNYPHMPTGAPASRALFERIVDFGRRHGIVIAHDNPYSFILNDNPQSILSVEGAREVCIELNSLSKSHSMAGWRVAMAASCPEMVRWLVKVKSNVDSGMFRPVMKGAVEALRQPAEWYQSINNEYSRRREVAEKIMRAAGCEFDPRQRGLFLWGRVSAEDMDGEALADRLLYEGKVFVTPGIIFGNNGRKYIRISLCAPVAELERALERVKALGIGG